MRSGHAANRQNAPSSVDFVDTFSPSRGRRVGVWFEMSAIGPERTKRACSSTLERDYAPSMSRTRALDVDGHGRQ